MSVSTIHPPRQECIMAALRKYEHMAVSRVRTLVRLHGVDNMSSVFNYLQAWEDLAILKILYPDETQ